MIASNCGECRLTLVGQDVHVQPVLSDRRLVDTGVVHDGHLAVQIHRSLLRAAVPQHDVQLGVLSHSGALALYGDFNGDVLGCRGGKGLRFGAVAARCFHGDAFCFRACERAEMSIDMIEMIRYVFLIPVVLHCELLESSFSHESVWIPSGYL